MSLTLDEALRERRSCRQFSGRSVLRDVVNQLLWAAQGTTGTAGERTAPSAGGHYPLEIYVAAQAVADLPVGVHRYDPTHHDLMALFEKPVVKPLRAAALEHPSWIDEAALIIVIAAHFNTAQARFYEQPPRGERGTRYVYIEAGATAQNISLQAAALDVGCTMVGGFDDAGVKSVLALPETLDPVAMLCIGMKA